MIVDQLGLLPVNRCPWGWVLEVEHASARDSGIASNNSH